MGRQVSWHTQSWKKTQRKDRLDDTCTQFLGKHTEGRQLVLSVLGRHTEERQLVLSVLGRHTEGRQVRWHTQSWENTQSEDMLAGTFSPGKTHRGKSG